MNPTAGQMPTLFLPNLPVLCDLAVSTSTVISRLPMSDDSFQYIYPTSLILSYKNYFRFEVGYNPLQTTHRALFIPQFS